MQSIEVNSHAHLFLRALSSHFPTACTKSNRFLYPVRTLRDCNDDKLMIDLSMSI